MKVKGYIFGLGIAMMTLFASCGDDDTVRIVRNRK